METTSNVGNEADVKPVDTGDSVVDSNQESQQEGAQEVPQTEGNVEVPQAQPQEVPNAETTEELTEPLEAKEEPVEEQPQELPLSPDEQIIDEWLNNGKTEVSMNELIQAGFDGESLDPHTNIIGRFRLSRLLLVSPFKIERNS